jgi:hypothetical protein
VAENLRLEKNILKSEIEISGSPPYQISTKSMEMVMHRITGLSDFVHRPDSK